MGPLWPRTPRIAGYAESVVTSLPTTITCHNLGPTNYFGMASGAHVRFDEGDLSAGFDTIDHAVLLKRLNCSFGITGTVYSWIQSYLTGRTQSVKIGTIHLQLPRLQSVFPRLCPWPTLLFSIYTSTISTIAQSHHVCQQQYADDTQLFLALSPANHTQGISVLQSYLNSVHIWFYENVMALDPN